MNEKTKELPACPVETTLTLIGDKWKVLILRDLIPGTKRFGELKGLCGSTAEGGILIDRTRQEPQTHSGLYVVLGRGL